MKYFINFHRFFVFVYFLLFNFSHHPTSRIILLSIAHAPVQKKKKKQNVRRSHCVFFEEKNSILNFRFSIYLMFDKYSLRADKKRKFTTRVQNFFSFALIDIFIFGRVVCIEITSGFLQIVDFRNKTTPIFLEFCLPILFLPSILSHRCHALFFSVQCIRENIQT